MNKIRMTKSEKALENSLIKGEYADVDNDVFREIARSVAARKKDAVLNIRVNSQDLKNIKRKAKKSGVRYQTFISEILHKIAQL